MKTFLICQLIRQKEKEHMLLKISSVNLDMSRLRQKATTPLLQVNPLVHLMILQWLVKKVKKSRVKVLVAEMKKNLVTIAMTR